MFNSQIDFTNISDTLTQLYIFFMLVGIIYSLIPILLIISKKFSMNKGKSKDISYRRIVFFVGLGLLVFIVASPIGGLFNIFSFTLINNVSPQAKLAIAPQIMGAYITCILMAVSGYVLFTLLCSFISAKMLKKYKINSVFVSNNKILGLF